MNVGMQLQKDVWFLWRTRTTVTFAWRSMAACLSWCSEWTCKQVDECGGCEPCQPSPPPPPLIPNALKYNPFIAIGGWYVNPTLAANLDRTIEGGTAPPAAEAVLRKMKEVPSAFWIDNKAKIYGRGRLDTLEGILEDSARMPLPQLCVFIFYDLPNRDCNAKASNGEIRAADAGGAAAALLEYKRDYVDPFSEVLARYSDVPVVLVIEPDSLGNVISNAGQHGCTEQTVANYKEGVRYAVSTIATVAPHAAIYVDAAHGGWMAEAHSHTDACTLPLPCTCIQCTDEAHSHTDACTLPLPFDSHVLFPSHVHAFNALMDRCILCGGTRGWAQPLTYLRTVLTYSLTHLLTYSLTHLLTYSLTHLRTYSLTYVVVQVDGLRAQRGALRRAHVGDCSA